MRRVLAAVAMPAATVLVCGCALAEAPRSQPSASTRAGVQSALPDPDAARPFLASIRSSHELQEFLERTVAEIGRSDPTLLAASPRIAVLDLTRHDAPRLASIRGDDKGYPASVVKFVYLMAAYAWQARGLLTIDAKLDAELSGMIRQSSNQATQSVFRRLTGTEAGPELAGADYAAFRDRRLAIKKWLQSLGIEDLHAVNPTYDGAGDLFGRDRQFLRDGTVEGGLEARDGQYPNRQSMTASGTVRLLALLATDRALTANDSAVVRRRMQRSVREQPHLVHRIAGGASGTPGIMVFSKSGTWGPVYADAGIVRDGAGRQFALAVFTEKSPPYRGDAIALLTQRLIAHLLVRAGPGNEGGPS